MISFNCTLQEGVIPDELRPKLASELARISTSVLGGSAADVKVDFREVRNGYGFRGGEISTTSMVQGQLAQACEQSTRVELLTQICDMWQALTGCTTDELVASARDPR